MNTQNMPGAGLTFNGSIIRDRSDNLNLTDMWRAAGADPDRRPNDWLAIGATAEFVEHVAVVLNAAPTGIIQTARGRTGSTWGHWQIGLAYAKYLSPEFHMWCNTVVRERMEGKPAPSEIDMRAIGGMVKGIVHKALAEALEDHLEAAIHARLTAHPLAAVGEYVGALKLCEDGGIPKRGRRGFGLKVSHRLRWWCSERGVACRRDQWLGKWVFPVAEASAWMKAEGAGMMADYKAKLDGQTVLQFPPAESLTSEIKRSGMGVLRGALFVSAPRSPKSHRNDNATPLP